MKSTSRFTIAAAASLLVGGFALTPAKAADLGGDCCADLEERVAELEATTVRKGNRNISVTLSGWVNQGVLWYDVDYGPNEGDSDVYVVDGDPYGGTRFRIVGSGEFKPGWSIGYVIELGVVNSAGSGVGPFDRDDGSSIFIRKSEWYVNSEQLGRLTVGQGSMAGDGITEINLGGTWGGGNIWGSCSAFGFGFGCNESRDPSRRNRVRYDSPTLHGFTFSAAWGEDDEWDVALRFSREWNGVRFAAGIGYHVTDDCNTNLTSGCSGNNGTDDTYGSLSLMHMPSGLFMTAAYATVDFERPVTANGRSVDPASWYASIGIRKRFNELGSSAFWVAYGEAEDFAYGGITYTGGINAFTTFAGIGDQTMFQVGFNQDIDAVGATFYLLYENREVDFRQVGAQDAEMSSIVAGMVVPF